jgi:hypothetical protein
VADDYLQEVQHKYEEYAKQAKGVHKLVEQADHAARAAGAASLSAAGGARTPPSAAATGRQQQQQQAGAAGADTATPSSPSSNSGGGGGLRAPQHTRLLTWQNLAAYCVQQLGMWPGSGVALPAVQQEALLRIVANSHLHLDPSISCRAYQLLLRNLRDHPPSQLLLPEGAAGDEPCGLLCATDRQSGLCWDMGFTPCAGSGPPLLQQPTTPFELLQQLVRNAVACLGTSGGGSSGGGSGRSSISSSQQGAGASQGQALLLMYVLELLQADLQARLAAFEQHRRLAGSLPTQAQRDEATQRAATVLRHSLLFRVMQVGSCAAHGVRLATVPSLCVQLLVQRGMMRVPHALRAPRPSPHHASPWASGRRPWRGHLALHPQPAEGQAPARARCAAAGICCCGRRGNSSRRQPWQQHARLHAGHARVRAATAAGCRLERGRCVCCARVGAGPSCWRPAAAAHAGAAVQRLRGGGRVWQRRAWAPPHAAQHSRARPAERQDGA